MNIGWLIKYWIITGGWLQTGKFQSVKYSLMGRGGLKYQHFKDVYKVLNLYNPL